MVPMIELNNGAAIPVVGFGVYKIDDGQVAAAMNTAFAAGYRSIDTASLYGNERGVGRAVRESGIPREELFVTTKLWNTEHGYDSALRAFDASLDRLGLSYVDLYLIHWPLPSVDKYVETWRAFERIFFDGKAKAIGVSNFKETHIRRLLAETDVPPAVNQVELHPRLQQPELRNFHREHGIALEAWSPLARGGDVLEEPMIIAMSAKYAKSPAQVILRWHLQQGHIIIPKSVTPQRIRENVDLFDFELDADDMAAIATLDSGFRTGADPDLLGL
jgi:diketogulonate reductase-like aldo/keto reductase